VLNLGGGVGIPYLFSQAPFNLPALELRLRRVRASLPPQFAVWMEAGRFLVAEAGVLLARVSQIKHKVLT
jgi:diaminopimelate decarboxylase/aspartate kinase